jgi:hypothetical protein
MNREIPDRGGFNYLDGKGNCKLTEIIETNFDYHVIPEADRDFLRGKEQSIKQRTAQTIIENGRDLLEAKARVGHGHFLKWVEGCFPWNRQLANKMMNVAENFKCIPGNTFENFQAKALYLLAAPSTPESARVEAIEKAEQGETITHKDARELVEAHKRITDLEKALADAKSTLPDKDTKQKIKNLETLLRDEKLRSGESLKAIMQERKDMDEKLKRLKDQQAKAIESGVKTEIEKMDKLISEKQDLADSIEKRVNELREARRRIDEDVEIEEAYKTADQKITEALYRIAIVLKDVLEDHPMPEKYEARFKKYMDEMQNGIDYIDSYFKQGEN